MERRTDILREKSKELYTYVYEFFNDDSRDIIHIPLNNVDVRNYVFGMFSNKENNISVTESGVYNRISEIINNKNDNGTSIDDILCVMLLQSSKVRINRLCFHLRNKNYYHLFDDVNFLNDVNEYKYKVPIPGEVARVCLYREEDIENHINLYEQEENEYIMNIGFAKIKLNEFIDDNLNIKYSCLTSSRDENIFMIGSDLFIKINFCGYNLLRESTRIIYILEDSFDMSNITYKEKSLKFALDMLSIKFLVKLLYHRLFSYDDYKFDMHTSILGKDLKPLFEKLKLTEYVDYDDLIIDLKFNIKFRYTLKEIKEHLMSIRYYKKTINEVISYKKRIYTGSEEDIDMTISELHNLLKMQFSECDVQDTDFVKSNIHLTNISPRKKPSITVDDILGEYYDSKEKEEIIKEKEESTIKITDTSFYIYNDTITISDLDKKFRKWYKKVINKYYGIDLCFTNSMDNVTIVSTNEIPFKKIIKSLKNLIWKEEDILLSDENILKILVHFDKISEDMSRKYLTRVKLNKLNKITKKIERIND